MCCNLGLTVVYIMGLALLTTHLLNTSWHDELLAPSQLVSVFRHKVLLSISVCTDVAAVLAAAAPTTFQSIYLASFFLVSFWFLSFPAEGRWSWPSKDKCTLLQNDTEGTF